MDIALAAAIGWFAGAFVLWRYMLGVCDEEHSMVVRLFRKLQALEDICEREGIIDREERETEPSDR